MDKRIDTVRSIEKMYGEEDRQIPYPAFMRCFDSLLADPPHPEPADPSPELKDCFRAVCLAVERGIADKEGRGRDRIREFYDRIYPAWKERLGETEFAEFQDILDGKYWEQKERRRKVMEEGMIGSHEEIDEIYSASDRQESHEKFQKLMQAALKEEEDRQKHLEEGEPEEGKGDPSPDSPADAPDSGAAPSCESGGAASQVPSWPSVKNLMDSALNEEIELRYSDLQHKEPLASYLFDDAEVLVRLVETPRSYYLSLVYPRGISANADVEQYIEEVTARMGYKKSGDLQYKKSGRNYSLKVKFTPDATHLACRTEAQLSHKTFARALLKLHKHLSEISVVFS